MITKSHCKPRTPLVLDGAPLSTNISIRDFQHGKAEYVVDAVEQALLMSTYMANLRSMKRHEVFLSLKRDLVRVSLLLGFLSCKVINGFL